MPVVPVRLDPRVDLAQGFDAIRAELAVPDEFPTDVLAEAGEAARRGPEPRATLDLREIPFFTVDPLGSRDLDQAVALERDGSGYLVRYAIADVSAFVRPGGPIDLEARRRVVTIYLPDRRTPLHPPELSEGAASLLPGEDRQALVWHLRLDGAGALVDARVERALVRSRRAWSYAEAQASLEAGTAEEPLVLLAEVGRLREQEEADRGGISLNVPEQIVVEAAGTFQVGYRAPLPVEGWNAQISLLTGMAAAAIMREGAVGILRTLPAPDQGAIDMVRRRARALSVPWPESGGYQAFVRALDARVPDHAVLLVQSARLLRGAGYVAFDGEVPPDSDHAAVAAPYAHVTAPLRRLVDRFGNEVVLALCAGGRPPAWVTDALPEVPALMQLGRQREGAADRMSVDLLEAVTLSARVGSTVHALVTNVSKGKAQVQVVHPAVVATVDGADLALGDEVRLRVASADPLTRRVVLEPVR